MAQKRRYNLEDFGMMLDISKRTAFELKHKGVHLMKIINYLANGSSVRDKKNYIYYSKDTELISETIKDKIWISYIDGVN